MRNLRLAHDLDDAISIRRLMELIAADLHQLECIDLNALPHEDQVDVLLQRELHEHELLALDQRLLSDHPVTA